MALRPSLRRRPRQRLSTELILTPFIDILVALILFLLMTAIFGKASILNLYLPTEAESGEANASASVRNLVPTVAITQEGFILGKGPGNILRIPLKEGQYDFETLKNRLLEVHQNPAASDNIIILPQANLRYQILITTMDTCREYKNEEGAKIPLFPVVSLGEYGAGMVAKAE